MKSLFCTGKFPTLWQILQNRPRLQWKHRCKIKTSSSSWGEIVLSERQICVSSCCKHSSFDWRQWAYLMTFMLSAPLCKFDCHPRGNTPWQMLHRFHHAPNSTWGASRVCMFPMFEVMPQAITELHFFCSTSLKHARQGNLIPIQMWW